MTPREFKEFAFRVLDETPVNEEWKINVDPVEFARRLLAEVQKMQEPVAMGMQHMGRYISISLENLQKERMRSINRALASGGELM